MTTTSLVGFTGFVGSNIAKQQNFTNLYNSKNIQEAFGSKPDILIYSGVRAEKFLANKEPQRDYEIIEDAIENIKKINPSKLVLISTIDVYKIPVDVNEDSKIDTESLHPYGFNRYMLEKWVEENLKDYLIVRLPGLYGENIKKNFIFDLINVIPSMINETKYFELCAKNDFIKDYFILQNNGFYKCRETDKNEKGKLIDYFNGIGFSALNFTDSRSIFQFYNLAFLWEHIQIAINNDIKKLNLSTQPILISELFSYIKGKSFINELPNVPPRYDFKSKYAEVFNGKDGYIFDKSFVLDDIKKFVEKF